MARLVVLAVAVIGLAAGFAAPASAAPEGDVTWAVHVSLAPAWFDPAETPAVITPFMMLYAMHDALVKPMPGNPMAPSLAESWSVSRDGLTYEFVLRKGVKFHNGDPVTAEDVKFSRQAAPARARRVLQGGSGEELQEARAARQRGGRQRRHPHRSVRHHRWHPILRGLSRHRRAVPGASGRARSEEARSDAAPHPATHARARDVRAAPRACLPQRPRAKARAVGRPHPRPRVFVPVRGDPAEAGARSAEREHERGGGQPSGSDAGAVAAAR